MKDYGYVEESKLILEITNGSHNAIARFKKGDQVSTKNISISDLIVQLSKDMEITTGILPSGTKFYAGTKNCYCIGVQIPAKVRTAEFNAGGIKTFTVPFPEMLFIFNIKNERIIESSLFSCIPPVGRSHDRLYRFPYGNVWKDGRICWGDLYIPDIKEPIVLDSVVQKFFNSVFSGHIIQGTNMFTPPEGVVNLRTLLEYLVGKDIFPDNMLRLSDATIGQAMSYGRT